MFPKPPTGISKPTGLSKFTNEARNVLKTGAVATLLFLSLNTGLKAQEPMSGKSTFGKIIEPKIQIDTIAPKIIYQSPKDSAKGVCVDSTILVKFDEPIVHSSLVSKQFSVQAIEGPLGGYPYIISGIYSYSDTSVSCDGTPHLPYATKIKVSVEAKDKAGNSTSHSFTFTTEDAPAVGVFDLQTQNEILQVFPNPVQESATIRLQLKKSQNVVLKIFDMFGNERIVYGSTKSSGTLNIPIDISDLSSGVYFLREEISGATRNIIKR